MFGHRVTGTGAVDATSGLRGPGSVNATVIAGSRITGGNATGAGSSSEVAGDAEVSGQNGIQLRLEASNKSPVMKSWQGA